PYIHDYNNGQDKQVNAQEVIQVVHKLQGDEKFEYDDKEFEYNNEKNDNVIK
ncbi:18269_t:CDS:2, partial [Gigaspora rosea]